MVLDWVLVELEHPFVTAGQPPDSESLEVLTEAGTDTSEDNIEADWLKNWLLTMEDGDELDGVEKGLLLLLATNG